MKTTSFEAPCRELATASRIDFMRRPYKLFLTVAGNGKRDNKPAQLVYIWRLETTDGQLIATNIQTPPVVLEGSANTGLYVAQKEALPYVLSGSDVTLFCPQEELGHVHSCDAEGRRLKNYRRSSTNKQFTNHIAIREVDELSEELDIVLRFSKPTSVYEDTVLLEIRRHASARLQTALASCHDK